VREGSSDYFSLMLVPLPLFSYGFLPVVSPARAELPQATWGLCWCCRGGRTCLVSGVWCLSVWCPVSGV